MQTTAIIKAAINVMKKTKKNIEPEIMVPLVLEVKELKYVKNIICETADKLIKVETLKDAAAYITQKTGRFVSSSHLGQMNGAKVSLASFAAGKEIPLFKQETPELPAEQELPAQTEPAPAQTSETITNNN